jgi:hypothetical protein
MATDQARTLTFITDVEISDELATLERDHRQLAQGLDHLEVVIPTMRRQAQALAEAIGVLRCRVQGTR